MAAVIRRYEVTDEEWEQIKRYIPEEQESNSRGRPSKDSRTMLNGIYWILRSGASWRDLPERYGPWQTVYKRFAKWSEAGIFEKIFTDLAMDLPFEWDTEADTSSSGAGSSSDSCSPADQGAAVAS